MTLPTSAGEHTIRPALPLPDDVRARLDRRPRLFFFDVDGTLAPIAPRPELAVVPAETLDALGRVAARDDTRVFVVSGRAAKDARRLTPIDGLWTIGNHGVELMSDDGLVTVDPRVARDQPAIVEAARRVRAELAAMPGVQLEDKTWTLSIHYRLADRRVIPGLTRAVSTIVAQLGLTLTTGKEVLEIRPTAPIDKGSAVATAIERFASGGDPAILYLGDDRTDEDAFRMIRQQWPDGVTIRVAADPSATDTAAELYVSDPTAARELLEQLAL